MKTKTLIRIGLWSLVIALGMGLAGNTWASQVQVVAMAGFAYNPVAVTVSPGQVVQWTNQDGTAHTVTSDPGNPVPGGPDSDTPFPSGFGAGGTYSWTVPITAVSGTKWYYHCRFHGSAGDGSQLGSGMAGVITMTTSAGTLQFSVSSVSVNEDAGIVTLTITRSGGSSGAASVNYATANGTASAGTDYTVTSGPLTWADGNSDSKPITVPIINRTGMQGSRSFTVTLSSASGASLGSPASTTVTINDPGVGPTIKANGAGGNVTVNYPETVSITVEMDAGADAGINKDWWVVALAGSSWYYMNNSVQWTQFDGNLSNCHPVYQGALFNLPATQVLSYTGLPVGSYTFWFAVDQMDGILNIDGPILVNSVNVTVQ